jgi:hypothetical protein
MVSISKKNSALFAVSTFLLMAYVPKLCAQQALVRSYENASLEVGQAYLTHYNNRCYAVLPTHVAEESAVPAFRREGAAGLLGESLGVIDLGDDLSLAELSGAITNNCGYSTSSISRAVDGRIASNTIAAIRSVLGDGTIAKTPVSIVDNDGVAFLRVQPISEINQIRKGQSGSVLMIDDNPMGMLLSVDSRFGVGKVMRLDVMLNKVLKYQAGKAASASGIGATASGDRQRSTAAADSTQNGRPDQPRVVAWNVMPLDPEHRAVNLFADEGGHAWVAWVPEWPATIDIDLPGDQQAINGIEFDGTDIPYAALLPDSIEILINSNADQAQWKSITFGSAEFEAGKAVFYFAPVYADKLQIRFHSANQESATEFQCWENENDAAPDGGLLGIRRLKIIQP